MLLRLSMSDERQARRRAVEEMTGEQQLRYSTVCIVQRSHCPTEYGVRSTSYMVQVLVYWSLVVPYLGLEVDNRTCDVRDLRHAEYCIDFQNAT